MTNGNVFLSAPTKTDLVIYRGDTGRFRVTVTDPDGNPVDVSTASWLCQIRRSPDSPEAVTLDVFPVSGDSSSVDVGITPDQSLSIDPNSVWDLQMTKGGDTVTLLAGLVRLTKDVSWADHHGVGTGFGSGPFGSGPFGG